MKIKSDFITNSSSANFTIPITKLTDQQIYMIENHIDESARYIIHRGPQTEIYNSKYDEWNIKISNTHVIGHTPMDNFDMLWFLKKIGVNDQHINYEDHC